MGVCLLLQIKSFATEAEVDAWLLSNPMYSPGALHFVEKNATIISYGVQTNSTALQKRGRYEDPTLKFQIPLQIAAEREIARFLIGGILHFLNASICTLSSLLNYLYYMLLGLGY